MDMPERDIVRGEGGGERAIMDASPFLLKSLDRKVMRAVGQSGRAADSGFVGVLTRSASKRRTKTIENRLLQEEEQRYCSDVQIHRGRVTISEEAQLFSPGGERPLNSKMLPSLGNRRARMIHTRKLT